MEAKVKVCNSHLPVNPHIQTLKIAPRYFKSTFDQIKNQEQVKRSEGLRVICAGLPRTGTLSLKAALSSIRRANSSNSITPLLFLSNTLEINCRLEITA